MRHETPRNATFRPTDRRRTLLLAAFLIASSPVWAREVYYGYDSAGRLALVNYGNGTGIRYSYDKAGNLIGKSVGAMPPAPQITQLSPSSGPAGTTVTIFGGSFETASEVDFGGAVAKIVSNGSDRLLAVVPAGATTGRVQVTTSGGTALSAGVFTVTLPVSETRLTLEAGGAASAATIGPDLPIRSGYATASVLSGPTGGTFTRGASRSAVTRKPCIILPAGLPSRDRPIPLPRAVAKAVAR